MSLLHPTITVLHEFIVIQMPHQSRIRTEHSRHSLRHGPGKTPTQQLCWHNEHQAPGVLCTRLAQEVWIVVQAPVLQHLEGVEWDTCVKTEYLVSIDVEHTHHQYRACETSENPDWQDETVEQTPACWKSSNTNARVVAFSCFGPHIWNSLPQDHRHCSILSSFKVKLKSFLFSQYLQWEFTYVPVFSCLTVVVRVSAGNRRDGGWGEREYVCMWDEEGWREGCRGRCVCVFVCVYILA